MHPNLGGVHVAQQRRIRSRLNDGEAAELGLGDLFQQVAKGARVGIHAVDVVVHEASSPRIATVLVGIVQVGVAPEFDDAVVDALAEGVTDKLRREHGDHKGNDELQCTGQLVHDDDQRDGDTADASENGRGPDHRVDARVDGGHRHTQIQVEPLDEDAHAPAEASARVEGGHEEATRHAGAEGDGHLQEAHQGREQEGHHQARTNGRLLALTQVHHVRGERARVVGVLARVEERIDGDGGEVLGVQRGEARDRGEEGDDDDLNDDRNLLPEGRSRGTCGADLYVPAHEQGAEQAAHDAEQDKPREFVGRGHVRREDLEHRQLPSASGVVPQQG
mmetsp:Transcript_164973/g.529588  ORF Transcript_164973/g.529588 Transcript_164973/m.529588 type:complete len:334 (+) Transcript_164973:2724-3725(+)